MRKVAKLFTLPLDEQSLSQVLNSNNFILNKQFFHNKDGSVSVYIEYEIVDESEESPIF